MTLLDSADGEVDPDQYKVFIGTSDLDSPKDPTTWSSDETLKLIKAYKKCTSNEADPKQPRRQLWAAISAELHSQGVERDVEKVENKWKSLLRSYRKGESQGGVTRFYFYDEMAEALGTAQVCKLMLTS